jgi:transcriptional regulator with XRE-family HTH domain
VTELKKIRTSERNITQFGLSLRSGVHPSRLSLIENGLTLPTRNEIERISEALNMLGEEIFGLNVVMKRLTASRKKEVE